MLCIKLHILMRIIRYYLRKDFLLTLVKFSWDWVRIITLVYKKFFFTWLQFYHHFMNKFPDERHSNQNSNERSLPVRHRNKC